MSANFGGFGGGGFPPNSNTFLNDIKMILTHSIIEDCIDKLTIINHLRNEEKEDRNKVQ